MRGVRRLGCSFTWVVRKSLSGKDSCENRLDRFESVGHEGRREKRSRPWEPQAEVGGIRVPSTPGVSKEARVGRAEWRRDHAGSWGLGKDTGFILERLRAMEYVSRGERWLPSVVKGPASAQWRRDHKRQEQNQGDSWAVGNGGSNQDESVG